MSRTDGGQSSLVIGLATLLRNNGERVLGGSSTLTLPVTSLQQLNRLFEQHLLSRNQQHGFLALPSHPADTASLLQLQFLFDILQKTFSLKLFNPSSLRLQFGVKIFPFKSLKCLELKNIPPHCLEGLRGVYSQLEVFICSKSLSSLEELLSLCGGDLSSALPWLELHTLNFSYNFIICLDQSLSLLNVLKSLDLSHNKIQECAEFLKPLSELEHLNLGYNCLQRAPTLSLSARVKLLTLILRNNELETINGVEQLASLQHLDLAYNLMLEHSQLAPLSLLHSLKMLNLDGNPLYFQKTHRTCTVRHLSPKAVGLRFKLDGVLLSSSELSVLPKPGQLIIQVQSSPPAVLEQSHGDVSSGAGELSDSLSVGEMRVSRGRKKKSKTKVKVRRASISEPSDTDYQAVSSQDIVLPHQEEIERMSSFREQLGEDWLRYQHHLDADVAPPTTTSVHGPETLSNSLVTSLCLSPEVLPPSLISSEPRVPKPDVEAEHETDSTLQWPSQSPQHTESTLEETAVDGQVEGLVHSRRPSLDSHKSAGEESGDFKEAEDEKDLGVDQCLPLLVGVLSDKEEEDEKSQDKGRKEVFLRVKQDHLLEVDVQSGQERCRLGLDCLAKVDATEAAWTHRKNNEIYPAVEIQFDYIMKEKRRRLYVLLDDNPQQALKDLVDVLSPVAEANRGRDTRLLPDCVHLQCLRCGSEFMEPGGRGRSLRPMMLPEGVDEQDGKALMECDVGDKGNCDNCPECGSDHLIQVAAQSFPYSSTPIQRPSRPSSVEKKVNSSMSSSLEEPAATVATEEPTFFSTQGSSLYIEEGGTEKFSLTCNADCQSKEELAGSYSYTTICATPPGIQLLGRANLTDDLDALSEAFEVVDHRLKLFLDVDIFEEEEELSCFLKTSIVKFGEVEEFPSLVVVSDKRVYILEVSPGASKGQLSDWLQKRDRHPILELSYLEVGLGSQSIHMAFDDGEVTGMAYTLLVRDSKRCKHFFGLLTGIVREMAHRSDSKLRSISTARLNPHHHLWPLVCEDIQTDVEDGHLQFCYILAFFLQDNMWTPMTVLATRETLYLLREDHQWGKSTNHLTTVNSTAEPSSGTFTVLETLPISCVSSVHLWSNEQCQMDVKLYDETQKEEKTWNLRSESSELLQALLVWVRTQWEAMFGVRLSTTVD